MEESEEISGKALPYRTVKRAQFSAVGLTREIEKLILELRGSDSFSI